MKKKVRVVFLLVLLAASAGLWYQGKRVQEVERQQIVTAQLQAKQAREDAKEQLENSIAARKCYEEMVKNGFSLETYTKMSIEAELAHIPIANIFQPRTVKIKTVPKGTELLYNNGWREATPEEFADFYPKAFEEEQILRQKIDEEYDRHPSRYVEIKMGYRLNVYMDYSPNTRRNNTSHDSVLINGEPMSSPFPGIIAKFVVRKDDNGVVTVEADQTEDIKKGWRTLYDSGTSEIIGIEVPDLIDIRPILAKDSLEVDGLYIYPI
jgi:hypothetical protein